MAVGAESGFDCRRGQAALFRLLDRHRTGPGGRVQRQPTLFELCASSSDMAPVIGRGVRLLHFIDQVREVAQGRNGCARPLIDERDVFACYSEMDGALDTLRRNAATVPFGC